MVLHKENFEDLHTSLKALTRSILELKKCSFFLNGSENHQKQIGNVISVLSQQIGKVFFMICIFCPCDNKLFMK